MPAAEVVAFLRANTTQFMAELDKAEAKIEQVGKAGGSSFDKLATVGKAAILGIGAAAVAGGVAAVDLAENYDVARQKLEAAAKGSGANFDAIQKAATGADGTMAKYGYTASQVEAATSTLTIAQGKHVQVQKDLSLAANIAAARHIDLGSAINIVNKAAEGNTGALKRMGIDLNITAGGAAKVASAQTALSAAQQKVNQDIELGANHAAVGSKAYIQYQADVQKVTDAHQKLTATQQAGTNVINALSQRFGGQAAAAADSFGGKIKALRAEGENLGITIGNKLIPILERIVTVVQGVIGWFEKHKAAAIALGAVISGVLATAIGAYVVLTGVKMVKSTIEAGKAVATLGKALVEGAAGIESMAVTYARNFAKMAIDAAKWAAENLVKVATVVATNVAAAASTAAAWIAANAAMILATGGIILAIGALILIVVEIVKHWGAVKEFFKKLWADVKVAFDDAWKFIKTILLNFTPEGLIYEHWRGIVTFFSTLWNAVSSGIVSAWNAIVSFFTTIPAKIINALLSFNELLLHWIAEAWDKFKSWVETAWDNEIAFWKAIPGKIINAVSAFGGLILNWITNVWNTFKSWIETAWNNEVAFWTTIPGKIINAVVGFASMFVGWIVNAWTSFNTAASNALGTALSWFGAIPGKILNALGDVGSILYNAGKAILTGLLNGLKAAWNDVTSFVGGLAGKIANLKGPLDYDAVLLTPHGNAIMQGLAVGLQQGFSGKVQPLLQGIAGQISGQSFGATGTFNAGITPISGGSAAQSGGSNQPVYLQVNGQTFATLMLPSLQTAVLQAQRGSSVPIFGSPQ